MTIHLIEGPFDGGNVYEDAATREGSFVLWQFAANGERTKGFVYKMLRDDRAMYQYVEVAP